MVAIELAEGFGERDPRLAASLNNLAELYRAQREYAEAEPIYRRSLAIWEQGPRSRPPQHRTWLGELRNAAT